MMTWYRTYVQRKKYRERHSSIFFEKGIFTMELNILSVEKFLHSPKFFEKGIITSELNILYVDKIWERNFHFGISKFFQNSTDTYMMYDPNIYGTHHTDGG